MGWFLRHGTLLLPVVATTILVTLYKIFGVPLSVANDLLLGICWSLALMLWIEADARRRGILPCHDFGFLIGVFFPVSVVWYAFWSRGLKGVYLLLTLIGLLIVPPTTAMLAWFLTQGLR